MAAENAAVKVSVYPLKPNKAIAKRLTQGPPTTDHKNKVPTNMKTIRIPT